MKGLVVVVVVVVVAVAVAVAVVVAVVVVVVLRARPFKWFSNTVAEALVLMRASSVYCWPRAGSLYRGLRSYA